MILPTLIPKFDACSARLEGKPTLICKGPTASGKSTYIGDDDVVDAPDFSEAKPPTSSTCIIS